MCGTVAQWIRHLTTNQGIPGSNPGHGVVGYSFKKGNKKILAQIIKVNIFTNNNSVIKWPSANKESVFVQVFNKSSQRIG